MKRILAKMIEKKEWDELYDYLEASAASLFSTPYLNELYAVIREVDLSLSKRTLPRLIVAWMAFLCGDHARAFPIVRGIAPEMLESPEAESMYEGLLALSGHTNNPEVGLAHAARSVQVLKDREPSLYLGNAYLTYGQLLAASKQYRHAAEVFHRSYDVFYPRGDGFAAAVAITNETLNRYRLGQFHEVIDLCHRELAKASDYQGGADPYWEILHLPLGMCYYEQARFHMALEHLEKAKAVIDSFGLLHMHGIGEVMLYRCYAVLNQDEKMRKMRADFEKQFESVHAEYIKEMLAWMTIVFGGADTELAKETMELAYERYGLEARSIVLESLLWVQAREKNSILNVDDLVKRLEQFRYEGHLPMVQRTLLALCSLHLASGKKEWALTALREAVELEREIGMRAGFFELPFSLRDGMKVMDDEVVRILGEKRSPKRDYILSEREREIMALIAVGKTNAEIGEALFISKGTVKWHTNKIFSKLGTSNRIQAAEKAKLMGEID